MHIGAEGLQSVLDGKIDNKFSSSDPIMIKTYALSKIGCEDKYNYLSEKGFFYDKNLKNNIKINPENIVLQIFSGHELTDIQKN